MQRFFQVRLAYVDRIWRSSSLSCVNVVKVNNGVSLQKRCLPAIALRSCADLGESSMKVVFQLAKADLGVALELA